MVIDEESCVTPTPRLFLHFLPILLQCSLLYPGLSPQPLIRWIRILLLPLNLYVCYSAVKRYCWRPLDDASGSNLLLSSQAMHHAFRSIEWAASKGPYFTHRFAWPDPVASNSEGKDKNDDQNSSPQRRPLRLWSWFTWSLLAYTSHRGSHFTWGLHSEPWSQIAVPTFFDLIRRLLIIHALFVPSLAYAILDRDRGVGWWAPNHSILTGLLSNLTFGITIMGSMELYYIVFSLIARGLHALPLNWPAWSAYWSPQAFAPNLFKQPHRARSMAEFWGRGWHAMFRWPFLVTGQLIVKPFTALGMLSGRGKRIAILFATFFCSGLYHDFAMWGIAYSPSHPNPFKPSLTSFIHTPMAYFTMQPIAILIEPFFLPHLSPFFQTIWVYTFTLISVTGFRKSFFGKGRMISGPPSIEEWGWREAGIPAYLLTHL
ncbi:uncharacterized protein MELLADRAFT_79453 [Melampsora larici-populina 98AG31]|uniref:Wax synthase domain-containing protein n=1 Tax=Melampsora larici-populina (strain 98AG31 / pathotype 3-4-7) TaxID=747676 RepID=F4S729_MELLP|nr:uncharacterized protein MELLADRAFT_79453 [Melampsora larici-populina 98AG31]EGF99567.1 hypothetical protein MELLADRAFT_79453 [Melampsora larici-populina 98AG31]